MAVGISFFQNLILIILFTIIIVFFIGGNETNIAESVVFIFVAYRLSSQLMSFQQNLNQIIAFLPSTNQLINFSLFCIKKMKLLILAPPRLTLREYFLKT